jgi:hypothetical protein
MICRTAAPLLASMIGTFALAATADAKPKIAILGLEVIDDGTMDAATTNTAKLITKRLRDESQKPIGPYELAPNSKRELLEMKLLSNCSDEGRGCMAAIGIEFGADFLMYAKIERQAGRGYHVNVKLLDTQTREMVRVKDVTIPFRDRDPSRIGGYITNLYKELVGMPIEGSLLVQVTNADSGTILVDGHVKGSLSGGTAKILGITEGRRVVSIEAPGFERHDEHVTLGPGQERTLSITLRREGTSHSTGGSSALDKVFFAGSLVVTAGASGTWWYYGYSELRDSKRQKDCLVRTPNNACADIEPVLASDDAVAYAGDPENMADTGALGANNNNACRAASQILDMNSDASQPIRDLDAQCRRGKTARNIGNVGWVVVPLLAAATGYLGYRAFAGGEGYESPGMAEGKNRKRPRRQIVPQVQVSPDGVGAGLTIEF